MNHPMPGPAMIRFPCPKCGHVLSAPEACVGRSSKCQACGQPVTVPALVQRSAPKPEPSVLSDFKRHRKAVLATVAAVFGIGFLLGCCTASVVSWAITHTPGVQGAFPEGDKVAAAKGSTKPTDDMTFQQLEDRLKAGGLSVSRVASRRRRNSMWFGHKLKDYHPGIVDGWEEVGELYRMGCIIVTRFPDSKQAAASASRVVDVQQEPAFAWGPFVFEAKQDVLDTVKAALNK